MIVEEKAKERFVAADCYRHSGKRSGRVVGSVQLSGLAYLAKVLRTTLSVAILILAAGLIALTLAGQKVVMPFLKAAGFDVAGSYHVAQVTIPLTPHAQAQAPQSADGETSALHAAAIAPAAGIVQNIDHTHQIYEVEPFNDAFIYKQSARSISKAIRAPFFSALADADSDLVASLPTVTVTGLYDGQETNQDDIYRSSPVIGLAAGPVAVSDADNDLVASLAARALLRDGSPIQEVAAWRPAPKPINWQRHTALSNTPSEGRAKIALIIDDLGLRQQPVAQVLQLPGPLTLAFLPYGRNLPRVTKQARALGHELLVHLPMEPEHSHKHPGPRALLVHLPEATLRERIAWNLSQFAGYVGINNHMGSRFTRSSRAMNILMNEVHERGILFIDSVTTDESVAKQTARRQGVKLLRRDVFLDHSAAPADIQQQIILVERIARKHGEAIAIAHPYAATLEILAQWLPGLHSRGFVLVPVSALADEGAQS